MAWHHWNQFSSLYRHAHLPVRAILASALGAGAGAFVYAGIQRLIHTEKHHALLILLSTWIIMTLILCFFLEPLSLGLRASFGETDIQTQNEAGDGPVSLLTLLKLALIPLLVVLLHEVISTTVDDFFEKVELSSRFFYAFDPTKTLHGGFFNVFHGDSVEIKKLEVKLELFPILAAILSVGIVTFCWITNARLPRSLRARLNGIGGAMFTGLILALLLRGFLFSGPACAFIVGNALVVGVIAIFGSLVMEEGYRSHISLQLMLAIIIPVLLAMTAFILCYPRIYGDSVPNANYFYGYLFVAGGWIAGLWLCPPYLERVILEKRRTGPLVKSSD
jgi:hypothetical protein